MSKALTAADIGRGIDQSTHVKERIFRERGEQRYSLDILPIGITFDVDRLRRSSHELWGELAVSVNGNFPHCKSVDGYISVGEFNFSSVESRNRRAKLLAERANSDLTLDWPGFLEEFALKILSTERRGEPSVILADYPKKKDDSDSWTFEGFPVLKRHPTVLFGKGASGKSYFAMWIAGQLANQDINVAYLDWELAGDDHRDRLERLFQPAPRSIHYLHCRYALRDQMDRIRGLIAKHQCQYAIFDSVGPASRAAGGRFQDGDLGQEYFGLVRSFGIGSLHIAHPPKRVDDEKDATIYGSAFFDYLARSVWFVQPTENAPQGQVLMGLYHHKLTTGAKLAPRAYRLRFTSDRTFVEHTDLKAIDELVAKLPLLERIQQKLSKGALTVKVLAADLDVPQPSIRKTLARHSSKFTKLDKNTVGLATTPPADTEMF